MYAYLFLGIFPLCTLLLEPCTFIDFGKFLGNFRNLFQKQGFLVIFLAFFHPARLLEPFPPCTFIQISKNVHPARLFQPARLLGR